MKIAYAIRDFFMPPKCAGCYAVFRVKYGEKNELCSECAKKWTLLKAEICEVCGKPYFDCRCSTKQLEKAGVSTLIKLVPYKRKSATKKNKKRKLCFAVPIWRFCERGDQGGGRIFIFCRLSLKK